MPCRPLEICLTYTITHTYEVENLRLVKRMLVCVFLRSPDSIQQSLLEASPIAAQPSPSDLPPFWRGSICAQEIAKVLVSAYLVSGPFNVPREVFTLLMFIYSIFALFCFILFACGYNY